MTNLVLALKLTADGRGLKAEVRDSRVELQGLGRQSDATGQQLAGMGSRARSSGQNLRDLDNNAGKTDATLQSLQRTAVAVVAALQLQRVGGELVERMAVYQDLRTRLTSLTGSTAAYAEAEQYLVRLADDHHKSVETLSDGYSRLLVLQNSGLMSNVQSRQILEGLSNAQSGLGANSQQLGQVMYGLSQALASGVVRAEEFNQVTEPLPGILQAMERAAGLAGGELRKLVNDGKITSAMFRDIMIAALGEFDGAAAATAANINAKRQDITNSAAAIARAFEGRVGDAYADSLGLVASGLQSVARNADVVIPLVGATLAASAARGVVALGSLSAASISKSLASMRATQATLAEANAEVVATAAEVARVRAQQGLMISTTSLTAATNAHTIALQRQAAAQAAVVTVGSRVLSVLGGPVGIAAMALTAGAAYLTMRESSGEARQGLDELRASAERLGQTARGMELSKLNKDIDDLIAHAADAAEKVSRLERAAGMGGIGRLGAQDALQKAKAENDAIMALLNQNRARRRQLEQEGDQPVGTSVDLTGLSGDKGSKKSKGKSVGEQADQALGQLRQEVALFGERSKLAQVNYEISSGIYRGLDPARQAALRSIAAELDGLEARKRAEEEYKALIEDLATPQEKLTQQLRERMSVLDAARARGGVNDDQYSQAAGRIAGAAFEKAPEFGGLAPEVGGAAGELAKAQEAEQKQVQWYERQKAMLMQYRQEESDINAQWDAQEASLKEQHRTRLEQIQRAQVTAGLKMGQQAFGESAELIGQLAGKQSAAYKTMFVASKAFAIADTALQIPAAIAKAANTPWPANIAAIASVVSMTAGLVGQVQSVQMQGQAHDGIRSVPAANEGTWMLKRDEMVLNSRQADNFGVLLDFVSAQQRAAANGGSSGGSAGGERSVVINLINQGGERLEAKVTSRQVVDDQERLEIVLLTKQAMAVDLAENGEFAQLGQQIYGWPRQGR